MSEDDCKRPVYLAAGGGAKVLVVQLSVAGDVGV